jgi:NADH dehydrogenase [ubiquinone] 1 alpha subcomplex assembly factor 5
MNEVATIFDRARLARHRDRAAPGFANHNFLVAETAERLVENLDLYHDKFPLALDIGCHTGELSRALQGSGKSGTLIQMDISGTMLSQASGLRVQGDEELLPFAPASFDLIISALSLHWVNDLPGTLIQLRKALKPGGVFMAALLGGNSLTELRQVMMAVEMAEDSGISPHISPFIDIKDAGALLQRAGFSMPVADSETITVTYENIFRLMHDLRGMGETSALMQKRNYALPKRNLALMAEQYQQQFPAEDGRIHLTFDVITMTGVA